MFQALIFYYFLIPNSVPLYSYASICSSIYLFVNTSVISSFVLLHVRPELENLLLLQ